MSVPAESVPAEPADRGVIHDIGYRHYSGPRLGRGYLLRSLYVDGLLGTYGFGRAAKSKIMPLLLLAVLCAPALIIAVVASLTGSEELPVRPADYPMALEPAIAIFVAAQAPALVSRDLRFHVLPLYLSRPLPRADYVLAKVAAMASAIFVLLTLPMTILYVGGLLAELPFGGQTGDYLAGLAGAVMHSVVLAVIGLLIASVTPRRGFGIAAVITVLLVLSVVAAILNEIIESAASDTAAGYAGLINPFSLVHGVQVWALGADPSSGINPVGNLAGLVFLLVTVAVAAGGYALVLLRYRKVSAV